MHEHAPPSGLVTLMAHPPNARGEAHDLLAHLREVARLARRFAEPFGAGEWAYLAGLWHDLGKPRPEWQAYIRARALGQRLPSPGHTREGAWWAARFVEPLALVVAGHHGGLPALTDLKAQLKDPALAARAQEAVRAVQPYLPELSAPVREAASALPETPQSAEMLLRFIFSALVDADFLDTEAHFRGQRPQGSQADTVVLARLWDRLQAAQAHFSPTEPMGPIRRAVYERCVAAALARQGWFRLAAPTGAGKTRAAMAFALRHALRHGLRRVIVAVPYTSITEQTASVYRDIFGAASVLEHHSAAPPVEDEELAERAELAAENWDAPIVVTTTVQLFESLFSNRPGACRKLHNIAASVILLDEAQALPATLMEPILDALHELSSRYRCTVVFSTATPPAWRQPPFADWLKEAMDLVPDAEQWTETARRVAYEWWHLDGPTSWESLAASLRPLSQVLVVTNTTADAAALWRTLDDPQALHLSRRLYGAHRRRALAITRERLKGGHPCRVVATQVVEAGVDVDFPVVYRALGPLDRIVQAAGRCNRERRQPSGRVVVFDPQGSHPPAGPYRTATDLTRVLIRSPHAIPDRPACIAEYFARLYESVPTDAPGIQGLRRRFDYPAVARAFRMVEEGPQQPVVVRDPAHEPSRRAVDGLLGWLQRADRAPGRSWWRAVQPYVVELPLREFQAAVRKGWAQRVRGEVWAWVGPYHPALGLAGLELA